MLEKLLKKAINKHKAKKYNDAENLYKKILRTDKHHLDANYMLGTLYAERNNTGAALKYLETAESINPSSPFIQNNIGNIFRLTQQFDKAINYYKRALELMPNMAEACNNLAISLKHTGNHTQAIEYYRRAIDINNRFADAWHNLGNLYWDLDELEQAKPCYINVLELEPEHVRAHDKLGTYYIKTGSPEKALHHFEKCMELMETDEFGIQIKLAYLNKAPIPEHVPSSLIIETYERKARNWDDDIKRTGMEFLGPEHIKDAFYSVFKQENNLHILDIGCGSGLCGEYLSKHAKRLVGVDLSQPMLDMAKNKQTYDELVNNDILAYLQDGSQGLYDVITGSGIVIFFSKLGPLLRSAKDCLKKNGKFIFTIYKSKDDDIEVRDNFHFAHSEKYIHSTARECGLVVNSISDINHENENGHRQAGLLVILENK